MRKLVIEIEVSNYSKTVNVDHF